MRRAGSNLPAYLQIVSLWTQTAFAYRVELAIELAGLLLKIFLLRVVWAAVYAGRDAVDGIPLDEVIAFTTLANLQLFLMASQVTGYLYGRIREGLIALDLARPVPFLGQLMAHQVGGTVAIAPFVLLVAPLAFLVGTLQTPASLAAGLLYLISLLLAYLITSLIGILVGLIAFWTTEIWGIQTILHFVSQFFSGALVPLWFFPPLLREVATWLPFQAQAFIPLSIFFGDIEGLALVGVLGLQVGWVGALFAAVVVVWRRAMRRVVVQGG
jgi:ABC-2 type transport system permease protein